MRWPWLGMLPARRGGKTSAVLLAAGWMACGIAFWAAESLRPLLIANRPAVTIEAFVSDLATMLQIEELVQVLEAQPFCCEAKLISSLEARAEAATDKRVRRLLEAFGGNPFQSYVRLKLCPEFVADYAQASAWLKLQAVVASVRSPEAAIERLLAGEKQIERIVWAAIIVIFLMGLLMAGMALCARVRNLGCELGVMEMLGAGPALIFRRILWSAVLPGVGMAALAALALRLTILVVRFSPSWWTVSPWLARMPAFSLTTIAYLLGLASLTSGTISLACFSGRLLKKPD